MKCIQINYFISQVTHQNSNVTYVKILMLNSPLLRQTDATFNYAIELCNCSFDMQPNLIKNACHPMYQ